MSNRLAQPFSLFHFQLKSRRFDHLTLRLLESALVSRDVDSLIKARSDLAELLGSELSLVLLEIVEKSLQEKLLTLEFFVSAFAIVGDVERCLAVRYEALIIRDLKSASYPWLQVSYAEWLNFAEQALHSGFHFIAEKACDNALLCIQNDDSIGPRKNKVSEIVEAIQKAKGLKHRAMTSVASCSVKVQAAKYIKKKTRGEFNSDLICKERHTLASTSFRTGIKKQNLRKLRELQSLRAEE